MPRRLLESRNPPTLAHFLYGRAHEVMLRATSRRTHVADAPMDERAREELLQRAMEIAINDVVRDGHRSLRRARLFSLMHATTGQQPAAKRIL